MSDNNQAILNGRPLDTPVLRAEYNKDNWREKARCLDKDPSMFFAEGPGSGNSYFDARCICFTCPVQKQCLDFAVENSEDAGIWGGLPYRERLKYKTGKRTHEITISELVRAMKGARYSISSLAGKIGVTEEYIRKQLRKGRYKSDNR